jgi:hypothetical protein
VKYRQWKGWTYRDLLRLVHPQVEDEMHAHRRAPEAGGCSPELIAAAVKGGPAGTESRIPPPARAAAFEL